MYREIISFIYTYDFGFDNCLPNKIICYPLESSFYPYILIAIIFSAAGLFFIVVFIYLLAMLGHIQSLKKRQNIDVLAYIGIIIAVAGFVIPFVLNTPLVDYVVFINQQNEIQINLNNFGIVAAKNVIISINTDNRFAGFHSFFSQPILPININNQTNGELRDLLKLMLFHLQQIQ